MSNSVVHFEIPADDFERAFAPRFTIDQRATLAPSDRTLYLMTAR